MAKTEHRISYKAGITRTPSDFLCEDGELAECINLTTDHEELKVMVGPGSMFGGAARSRLVYVHEGVGYKNYICTAQAQGTNSTLTWFDDEGNHGELGYRNWNTGTLKMAHVGKTLIVSDRDGMRYFLWTAGGVAGIAPRATGNSFYKDLGEQIPRPRVLFKLGGFYENAVDEQISCSGTIYYDDGRWGVVLNQQANWNNAVVGLYEKLKKQLHQKKCFFGSFSVRVALKLVDGSYYHVSDPIMMINQFKSYCVGDIRDEQLCLLTMKLYGQELWYMMLEDFSDWSDLVTEVTLFVSAEERLHDTSADATIIAGRGDAPICSFISGNTYYNHSEHIEHTTQAGDRHILLNSISDAEVGKNLVENGLFYRLCGLGKKDMNDWAKTSSLFTVHALENIVTQTQLSRDDYYSHCRLIPGYVYAYNSRLNLANVSRGFFGGFDTFLPYDNASEYTYTSYVYIKTSSGERVVSNEYTTKEKQGLYFYYPDPRAYRAVICVNGAMVCDLSLTEHPNLNGAYYFGGMPTGSEGSPTAGSGFSPAVDESPEYLTNQIVTSEVNNPFVFNSDGYNTVGNGKILAMATQTAALSSGQYGQFPLIVFTSEGLWSMSVDRTGLYDTISPMPREVCINPNAILETDGAVFFVSQKGLMVIVGNEVHCVSELMNGKAFSTASIPAISNGNDWSSVITSCADAGGFLQYVRDSSCFMAYDYVDSRILLMRPDKTYHYVYNIQDGTISKAVSNGVQRAVKSYPDYLLQNSSGSVFSLYGKQREDEVSVRGSGFLLTRPMKLSGPVTVKSLRELVNVGYWDKEGGSSVKTAIFVSDNLVDWYKMESRFGAGAKYFRIALYINMLPTERLSGTVYWDQERRDENARV